MFCVMLLKRRAGGTLFHAWELENPKRSMQNWSGFPAVELRSFPRDLIETDGRGQCIKRPRVVSSGAASNNSALDATNTASAPVMKRRSE